MRGITKMLGLGEIDFETLGKQLVGGIDEYNKKLDLILWNQHAIMKHLKIAPIDPSGVSGEVTDVQPVEPK